jgi:hypothetical protein
MPTTCQALNAMLDGWNTQSIVSVGEVVKCVGHLGGRPRPGL